MPALKKSLTVDKGATLRFAVQVVEADETTPKDLSGCTATFVIKHNGVTVTTLAPVVSDEGWVTTRMQYTSTLPVGTNTYYLDLTWPSGDIDRLFYGPLEVKDNG
jgi:hypothetical protein